MNKREKCSTTQKGRIVIHKDDKQKRVYESDLDLYLNDGWCIGMSEASKAALGEAHKGKQPWNKGLKGVNGVSSSRWAPGHTPWNKGLKGCQTSSRKGLTRATSELVYRIAASNKANWDNNPERHRKASINGKKLKGRKLSESELQHFLDSTYNTRLKNSTFNTSKSEDSYFSYLCSVYGEENVKRQYRDKVRYPFRCDFYIVSEDKFIELNLHWTHGGMPFDSTNQNCLDKLSLWQEKAKKSKFYRNAIYVWTQLDVKKLQCCIQNNLNYEILYNL